MTRKAVSDHKQNSLKGLVVLGAILAVLGSASTPKPRLRGITLFEDPRPVSTWKGLNTGISFAGGADMMIAGFGFQGDAADNRITMKTSSITGSEQTFIAPQLTNLDETNSKPLDGRLYYRPPSVHDLLGGRISQEMLRSVDRIDAEVQVQSGESSLECTNGSSCNVRYSWEYTPEWYQFYPPVMYQGMDVTLGMNPRKAIIYKAEDQMAADIRVNGARFLADDYTTEYKMEREIFTYLRGTIRTPVVSKEADVLVWMRGAGYAMKNEETATFCNWDVTDCYSARVLAHISHISETSGSVAGGQELVIKGGTFDSAKSIEVTVDEEPCEVTEVTDSTIKCLTGEKAGPGQSKLFYPGDHGLYRTRVEGRANSANYMELPQKRTLMTNTDIPPEENDGENFDMVQGFYEAPADGKYQFHMSCDTRCQLWMSRDPSNPQAIEMLQQITVKSNAYREKNQSTSEWITLEKGQKYYFENHLTYTNRERFWALGVEIESSTTLPPAIEQTPQIQELFVHQDLQRDTSQFRVRYADGGTYSLLMMKRDLSIWTSEELPAGCSARNFGYAVKRFYMEEHGAVPEVTLECELSSGARTPNCGSANVTDHIYTVRVPRSIQGRSVLDVRAQAGTSKSTFEWFSSVQVSNPPLTGNYFIECYNLQGVPHYTYEIGVNSQAKHVVSAIGDACPWLQGQFDLAKGKMYNWQTDGIDWILTFSKVRGDLKQFKIHSGLDNPLKGINVRTEQEIVKPYGPNVFFEVIPFEQLYTAETQPPIKVSMDGMPVLCKSTHCSYTYETLSSRITDFSVNGLDVVIKGVNLPSLDEITSSKFSKQNCDISSSSDREIRCSIKDSLVAGSWTPQVKTSAGLVRVDESVKPEEVPMQVDNLSTTTFRRSGGEILTIKGAHFPANLDTDDDVSVTFEDGTLCVILSVTSEEITCKVNPFKPVQGIDGRRLQETTMQNVVIKIGNIQVVVQIETGELGYDLVSITPDSLSPILTGLITVQLPDDYGSLIFESDVFTVQLQTSDPALARADGSLNRDLAVVGYDSDQKTITVKYGGARSGIYDFYVSSDVVGSFSMLPFEAKIEILDFNPKQGSKYGGTIVTITGGHFSDNVQDNPVKIGYNYQNNWSHYCDVISTSDSEIVCKMSFDVNREAGTVPVIVFAGTAEEAVCSTGGTCDFTFLEDSSIPSVSTAVTAFDDSTGKMLHTVTISGTGVTTSDKDEVQVTIGGVTQTIRSVSPTLSQVVVEITDLRKGLMADGLEVIFPEGIPSGYDSIFSGVTFTPVFLGIEIDTGSQAGAIFNVIVSGIGTDETAMLVDTSDDSDICESATWISYGILECNTGAKSISSAVTVGLTAGGASTVYACQGYNSLLCTYQTVNYPSYSFVDRVTPNARKRMRFTTSDLDTIPGTQSCIVSYNGISCNCCEIIDSTRVEIVFEKGIPTVYEAESPILTIVYNNNGVISQQVAVAGATLNYNFESNIDGVSKTCSFAGGCTITLGSGARGLTTNVLNNKQQVVVGGFPLIMNELVSGESETEEAQFVVPEIRTVQSQRLAEPVSSLLPAENEFFSEADLEGVVFDGQNLPGIVGTSAGCYVGNTFSNEQEAVLDSITLYMDTITQRSLYENNLKFQGSNDDFNTVDFEKVIETIHEGPNIITFDSNSKPSYKSYRLYNAQARGCDQIGELKFYGAQLVGLASFTPANDPSATQMILTVQIYDENMPGANKYIDTGVTVTYDTTQTPHVVSVNPKYGSVEGGTSVTLRTSELGTVTVNDITVTFDSVDCAVQSVDTVSIGSFTYSDIVCTSGARTGAYNANPTLNIQVGSNGLVDSRGLTFKYVQLWSSDSTWNSRFAPVQGESVVVPSDLALLVDISPPQLNLVIVEGTLIFPSDTDANSEQTFDANVIFVNGGLLQAGTESDPLTSKLTITMHGASGDPTVPLYGNKVLAVRGGTIDLHGRSRNSWTKLEGTASAGSNQVTLAWDVDWEVGEQIIITSTEFDRTQAEEHTIQAKSAVGGFTTLTLESNLAYRHQGGQQSFTIDGSAHTVNIQAEVALLDRNIVFQGDDSTDTTTAEHGAQLAITPSDTTNSIGRISNVKFQRVGQMGKVGRYPIYFNQDGDATDSSIHDNVIMNSYNRGAVLRGVENLRVAQNVFYGTKGNTMMVEDGNERRNVIEKNLVINPEPSYSLTNADVTPACFWIRNPDNVLIDNHCAGGSKDGFWYDLVPSTTGTAASESQCPSNEKLGGFRGNVAHSLARHGLVVFAGHSPRKQPCSDLDYDPTGNLVDDNNPFIQAIYEDFITYKNGLHGVVAGEIGAVTFQNIQSVDNKAGGVEVHQVGLDQYDQARVIDSLIVGQSSFWTPTADDSPLGITGPRSDYFSISNVKFANFNFNSAAALSTCAGCSNKHTTDADGRTICVQGLSFADVTRRVNYGYPYKGIIKDIDGTLTDQTPLGGWATSNWKHNSVQPECNADNEVLYGGLTCDNTVRVQTIVFSDYEPDSLRQKQLNILPYDARFLSRRLDSHYEENIDNYAQVDWREAQSPVDHWAAPFVTGKRYLIRWGSGTDFEKMDIKVDPKLWDQDDTNDDDITLIIPYSDDRETIDVTDTSGTKIPKNSITLYAAQPTRFGYNQIDDNAKELELRVNGDLDNVDTVSLTGVRCTTDCLTQFDSVGTSYAPPPTECSNWSDVTSWTGRTEIPQDDEALVIPVNTWFCYDIATEDAPNLLSLEVNGRLDFEPSADRLLKTRSLFVRSGQLNIGSSSAPFPYSATIELQGDNQDQFFTFTQNIEAGNKNLVITGDVNMYGLARTERARLATSIQAGQSALIEVDDAGDWGIGDQLVIAPTNMRTMDTELCTIFAISGNTITCETTLANFHYGDSESTETDFGVDMRAEVSLLTRNVRIIPSQEVNSFTNDVHGCRILVADFIDTLPKVENRVGHLTMSYVEVAGCGQRDTFKSAIKFEYAAQGQSTIQNSAIHSGKSPGIIVSASKNVTLKSNVVTGFYEHGIWVKMSENVEIDQNQVFNILNNINSTPTFMKYYGWTGAMTLSETNLQMTVTNNVVAGAWHHGYHFDPSDCDAVDPDFVFTDNVAHSISGYGAIARNVDTAQACTEVKDFKAYKVTEAAIMLGGISQINRGRNLVTNSARYGFAIMSTQGNKVEIYESHAYGENAANIDCNSGDMNCEFCLDTRGMILNLIADTVHRDREKDCDELPLFNKEAGSVGDDSDSIYYEMSFSNFNSGDTHCGGKQHAIRPFVYPNYTPYAEFQDPTTLTNVAQDAFVYIDDAPSEWNNPDYCGNFECTGMNNIVIRFREIVKAGLTQIATNQDSFNVVSTNSNLDPIPASNVKTCEQEINWNAWRCSTNQVGILVFESDDDDNLTRALQPIYIDRVNNDFSNKLNAFMNECSDEDVICLKRRSRFASIVQLRKEYEITYTGTPPEKQTFRLFAIPNRGVTLSIKYNSDKVYQIYDADNNQIAATDWDADAGEWRAPGENCGEHRYSGVTNTLQFFISADDDCIVKVVPRDAVMMGVRLEFTLTEFFSQGGVVTFVHAMAGVLNIHPADIKIVEVYEGSTIVKFQVMQRGPEQIENGEEPIDFKKINLDYRKFVTEEVTLMGSPILNAEIEGGEIQNASYTHDAENDTNRDYIIIPEELENQTSNTEETSEREEETSEREEETIEIEEETSEREEEPSEREEETIGSEGEESTTVPESEDVDEVVTVVPEPKEEESDLNIFGDATNESTTTVVVVKTEEVNEDEKGTQELFAEEDSDKITEVRTVVVQQEVQTASSVSSKYYLVIIGIVIIAFVIILALICLVKRCRKVDERAPVAEFVEKERDKAKFVDEEFTNIGGVFGKQYTPKLEMDKNGFCLGKSTGTPAAVEGAEGAEDHQDPPEDLATDRNLLDEKDVAPVQMTEKELAYVLQERPMEHTADNSEGDASESKGSQN